jgi:ribonuclease HI
MVEIFADGGSRGNPGHSAYGFVVKVSGKVVKEGMGYIGIETNNFAEYTALIEALSWLSKNYKGESLKAYLDSNLVVSQLSGLFRIKSGKIKNLAAKVRRLEPNFKRIEYRHIPREQNKHADKLVNIALDRWS